ncbi:hypothetical protein ACOZ38_12825 [Sphaerisporangium viridialbum]|uniref:hypothetical protein n=1 Tax=Sphaerisporangium viridialbum TaxID=46189 RepID=UPI003C77E831
MKQAPVAGFLAPETRPLVARGRGFVTFSVDYRQYTGAIAALSGRFEAEVVDVTVEPAHRDADDLRRA